MIKKTDAEITEAVNSSLSMAEATKKLGINYKTLRIHAERLGIYKPNKSGKGIKKEHFSLDEILLGMHPNYSTHLLRLKLINERGWPEECSQCKLTHWQGFKIPLELDHIDGVNDNHLESNLRILCPNCHALTPTYKARNKKPYQPR